MDWLLAIMLMMGSLSTAAAQQAKAEALQKAVAAQAAAKQQMQITKAETALYQGNPTATSIMQSEWTVLPDISFPGDAVLVRSKHEGNIKWQGITYSLQHFDQGYYTYLPISIQTKPGTYTIGGTKLVIKAKKFPEDILTVTKEQNAMIYNYKRINADQKKINAARSHSAPTFLSKEPFIIPVKGRLSTPYGYTRIVNGKYDGSHRAIDLAAPTGTKIKATNDGKVVLADTLYLTGNSIYIDHGMNLFSQYGHLSKLLVKTGDFVKKGQVIGLVGTTGFSTGPHLHFTFWIKNTPVNPNLFFDTTPFQWHDPS